MGGSETDSYLRLIDFVYHSTLGLAVIKRKDGHPRAHGDELLGGGGVDADRRVEVLLGRARLDAHPRQLDRLPGGLFLMSEVPL